MAENTNTEREAFEAWARNVYYGGMACTSDDRKGSSYSDPSHHIAWQAFQAGRASLSLPAAGQEPDDPMDWKLPCDVTVGHGTMCKGVSLRTLVTRMKVLYEMATGNNADEVANRTPEQRTALADAFRARLAAAPQPAVAAGWMPIETAPKDGSYLLLWEQYSDAPFVGYWSGGSWSVSHEHVDAEGGWDGANVVDALSMPITHWMPLPPAPSTEGESNG